MIPGVGERTAQRMIYFFLEKDKGYISDLSLALQDLKEKIGFCEKCFNYSVGDLCDICSDSRRDSSIICVVSKPQDIIKIEESGEYQGLYHCLCGVISPIQGIGPDDIKLRQLMSRLDGNVKEIILALNSDYEGESTAFYIGRIISKHKVSVTRLATGLPIGSIIEYIDPNTLKNALKDRRTMF